MNKKEAIEKIEKRKSTLNGWEELTRNHAFDEALDIVRKIDEPEKPTVPQYVADWYEENKDDFEFSLYTLVTEFRQRKLNKKLHTWYGNLENKPTETLVMMHKFGYEVKKEKLYTVKFSNEDFGKIYIGIFKKFNKLGISSLPLNDDEIKSWFTEDELKRFKFWDNPAFEINEVEEVSRLTDGAWNTLAELNGTEVDE